MESSPADGATPHAFMVKMKDNECAKISACFFFLHGILKKIYVSLYITPRTVLGS